MDIGQDLFKCKLCEKTLRWRQNLKRHYESVHTVGNEIACPECGHIVNNKHALRVHKYWKHKK